MPVAATTRLRAPTVDAALGREAVEDLELEGVWDKREERRNVRHATGAAAPLAGEGGAKAVAILGTCRVEGLELRVVPERLERPAKFSTTAGKSAADAFTIHSCPPKSAACERFAEPT